MIDKDEYPQTALIETRCWRMLADLWNAPDPAASIGTSTVGSSEACMLGGLALKRRWQHRRRADKKPTDAPNIVLSSTVQVCWEKFCNYWEVEARYVPVSAEHPTLDGPNGENNFVEAETLPRLDPGVSLWFPQLRPRPSGRRRFLGMATDVFTHTLPGACTGGDCCSCSVSNQRSSRTTCPRRQR